MPKVDLCFPVLGEPIPADHGYFLYSAVSRLLLATHQADGYGIHPVRGQQLGGRTLRLTDHGRLVIRTDVEQIARFLPLAGKQLRLLDRMLRFGTA
jgi:CRISPR-associated protein Cas6